MRNVIFLLFLAPLAAHSQKIENAKAEASGEKIIITYDLTLGEAADSYTVSLFASHNNFTAPVTRVTGDIGQGVRMGRSKRIEWESKVELGKYKGPLTFEIEVRVIAAFTLKTSLVSVKRGKPVPLQWRGGDQNQNVKIELLKAGAVEGTITTSATKGLYEWNVPAKQLPGKDYSLRLSNGKETVTSPAFAINHKIPLVVKVLPVVAVGVVILLLPKHDDPEIPSTSNRLVSPPEILD